MKLYLMVYIKKEIYIISFFFFPTNSYTVQQYHGSIISNQFYTRSFERLKHSLTIAKVILSWDKKHIAEDTRVELNQQIIGIQGTNIFWNSFNK